MQNLKSVANTLFIPLQARIYVSKKFPKYFYDEKALSLQEIIPSNILQNSNEYSFVASVARYYNTDEMSRNFIQKCERCNIINLGVGLETNYERINQENANFYKVDFEDVIDFRRKFLKENKNRHMISGDMFGADWVKKIDATTPTLILVLGVFEYFHEQEVLDFIAFLKKNFAAAELIFDATDKSGLKFANKYVSKLQEGALMHFFVDDAKAFANKTETTLLQERPFFTDARKILAKKANLYTRLAMWITDIKKRAIIVHLKLN
ncbi:MAG: class I SAM-dependent methyltransferase [Campylobacter sp.]|nr:class I SAM-dependent methyltransferase [Campylobacter sp.]